MNETSRILGPDGRPASRAALAREEATPAVTGVRATFDDFVAAGLTPRRLAQILRDAALGETHDFMTLAEEMEEREPHYRYVLETRKNAITQLEPKISPLSDKAKDAEIADFLREFVVEKPAFKQLPDMMADGIAKGYSLIEIVWSLSAKQWLPDRFVWRDQRLFQFDRETRSEIRLRAQGEPDGRRLSPLKFINHVPMLKMGLPVRNGLARVACWAFMLKSYTLKDWATFLEVYGMPLRLGKYPSGASGDDKRVLLAAVRNLGSDAAAIVPAGMEIEFVEGKAAGEKAFQVKAEWLDQQMSKLIIGKPRDGESGARAAEETLDKVRIDIKRADARDIELTLNAQIIQPIIDLNFGPQEKYPWLSFPVADRKDIQVFSNAVTALVDRGLRVEQSQIYDVLGLKEPAQDAILLTPSATGPKDAPQTPVEKAGARRGLRFDRRACPGCGAVHRLAADGAGDDDRDDIDDLTALAIGDWEPQMAPIVEAIMRAASGASDYASFEAAIARLETELPVAELARRLAVFGMIGRGLGQARD